MAPPSRGQCGFNVKMSGCPAAIPGARNRVWRGRRRLVAQA